MKNLLGEASKDFISSQDSFEASDIIIGQVKAKKFVKHISLEVEKCAYLVINIIQTSYASIWSKKK